MSNDFFDHHPLLGLVFDFDHDGSVNLAEAGAMGAFAAMFASEATSASEEAEREASRSSWDDGDDDDDDDYDLFGNDEHDSETDRESVYDFEDVDMTSRWAVMRAVRNDDYDDIDCLVEEALDNGVRFKPEDIIELSYHF